VRKHKGILLTAVFLVVFIIINSILNFILIPSCLTRVILHELVSSSDYKCVVLGTSHGAYGIDADIVSKESGKKTMNLCIGGEYLQDSYYLLKKVFETNHPDTIIFDMDYDYLFNIPRTTISGSAIYNLYPFSLDKLFYFKDKAMGMEYRAALFPWMDYRENFSNSMNIIKTKLSSDYINYNADTVNMIANNEYKGRGHIYRDRTDRTEKIDLVKFNEAGVDQASVEYFKKIVEMCNANNAKIIMITTPISVEQINASFDDFDKAFTYLSKLATDNNIPYYNFNLVKDSVFSRSLQDYNIGHLYGDAAARYSVVLGQFAKDVEDGHVTLSDYFYDSIRDLKKK